MRKLLYLFAFALLLNCSTDKANQQVDTARPTVSVGSGAFRAAVGAVDQFSGKISFKQDQKVLLTEFNSFLKKQSGITAKLKRLSIDQVNGNYYLRGFGNTYKSTMLLKKNADGSLQSMGVSCTTSACATTSGCEVTADGTCSPCSGGCRKTTTLEEAS